MGKQQTYEHCVLYFQTSLLLVALVSSNSPIGFTDSFSALRGRTLVISDSSANPENTVNRWGCEADSKRTKE